MIKLLLTNILLIFFLIAQGQNIDTISLQKCIQKALENYQIILKTENNKKIIELQQLNYKLSYLPTLKLESQATYQSQVLEIQVPIPNIDFPEMPYAQYKTYLEINQLLYDGGLTNTNLKILEKNKESNEIKSQIEQKELISNVGKLFFYIVSLEKQKEILIDQQKTLQRNLQNIEIAISNNSNTPINRDILKIEIIKIQQKIEETTILKEQLIQKLSIYTNQHYTSNTLFYLGDMTFSDSLPQNLKAQMIDKTIEINELKNKAIRNSTLPQIYAFGQFGYGRPGLNLLSKDFNPYAFIGVKLSWRLWDWRQNNHNIQINKINSENLKIEKNNINIIFNSKIIEYKKQIELLEKTIEMDLEMIRIQQNVVNIYKSQLENGLITSSQYIEQLNKLSSMQITYELHKIQLLQTKFELSNLY